MKSRIYLACLVCLGISFPAYGMKKVKPDKIQLHLRDLKAEDGRVFTDHGGYVCAENLYIQADQFEYTDRIVDGKEVRKVVATGNLFLAYYGKFYMGDRIEYDFLTKTGRLTNGRTAFRAWYVSGQDIQFQPNGDVIAYHAMVSTDGAKDPDWQVHSYKVTVKENHLLGAQDVTFRVKNLPVMWLPSFNVNTRKRDDPAFKYNIAWEKGLGPKATLRYRFYSSTHTDYFYRFEYRYNKGVAQALETNYFDKETKDYFQTKNYWAFDQFIRDNHPRTFKSRYRLQGIGGKKKDGLDIFFRWDKYSDIYMPSEFQGSDFELNTARTTELRMNAIAPSLTYNLKVKPKVNNFDQLKVQAPLFEMTSRPVPLTHTSGIILSNDSTYSYQKYSYSNLVDSLINDFESGKMGSKHRFQIPINLKWFTTTLVGGWDSIYYTKNPSNKDIGQGAAYFQVVGNTLFRKAYDNYNHVLEPYVDFMGFSSPTAHQNQVYIFDITDGYHKLSQIKVGLRSNFFQRNQFQMTPEFSADAYLLGFFKSHIYKKLFPRFYLDLGVFKSQYSLSANCCWNTERNVLNYAALQGKWTVNQYFAFNLLFTHRGKFEWVKCDYDNYILNVTNTAESMLGTPLSEPRNLFVARWQIEPLPGWTAQIRNHVGWGQSGQPAYHESWIDLFTVINSAWKVRVSFNRTVRDKKISFGVVSFTPD
ncbi:MAG: hypothetical protein S4CHLAM102_10460 [Chlamydiia bacterium]|nr:hypothetical protein [Chlamydiia bacterium]